MRRGLSLIEILGGLALLSMLLQIVYLTSQTAIEGSHEGRENHLLNATAQRIISLIEEDVRESSAISLRHPPFIIAGQELMPQTAAPENRLHLVRYDFDFALDPSKMTGNRRFYSRQEIRYFLQPDDQGNGPASPVAQPAPGVPDTVTKNEPLYCLIREVLPFDSAGKPLSAGRSSRVMARGIKELVFFRYKNPGSKEISARAPSARSIFLRLLLSRQPRGQGQRNTYHLNRTASVHIRGSEPEGF